MKKFLVFLCVAISAMCASAQITWNVKGGAGYAFMLGDTEGLSGHFVGKIGAGIEKPLSSNWSLMPSLELAWKGAIFETSFTYTEYGSQPVNLKYNETVDLFYIQIPVLAAYRINLNDSWNMTLNAGPYFAVAAYGNLKESLEASSYDYKDKVSQNNDFFSDLDGQRFDVGLDIAADLEYHRFVFGVEFEVGFISILGNDQKLNNAALYATVGYKF